MLDRDAHGANFADFDEAEFQQYLGKQAEVDSEKDTEKGGSPHVWNLATTQAWNDPDFAPSDDDVAAGYRVFPPWLDGGGGDGGSWADQVEENAPEMSDEDKAFLETIKDKPNTELTADEINILTQLAGGGLPLVYGEDW